MFTEIAKKRFSCRSYKNKPVEKDKVKKIIEAARIAPSANNFQPWFFYVIQDDKKLLTQIHNTYHREWFNDAQVVIVACADYSKAWRRQEDGKNHAEIDTAIAIDHITLQATDLGLATCWVCHFDVLKVKEVLQIPDYQEPIALIPIGYCNSEANLQRFDFKRKKIEEIADFR
jgi:nitroreductase